MQYDLLVVGAGCAGCIAAYTASKIGLSVLILDRKAEATIGDKVCGDALGSHHLSLLNLSLPSDCFYSSSPGIDVFSPDRKSVFSIEDESLRAVSLKRHAFGQFLLRRAISAGAELVDSFHVSCPIFEGSRVAGVRGFGKDGVRSYSAKVVAECSGTASVVRHQVPDADISRRVPRENTMACYREIRRTNGRITERLQIYLDQEKTPGGYAWIFPLGDEMVNVGLGVKASEGISPRDAFFKYLAPMEILAGSTFVNGGGGIVPTTKPMDSMVYDGLMVAGDSASTVSPMHGGGIGSSMLSGKILAEVCAEALSKGSVERKGLWEYNRRYMLAYGAKQASLDAFRRFLQASSNDEINFGMAHEIVKPKDILLASKVGDLNLSITEKATRAFRGIGKIDFLIRLRNVARLMKEIKKLYMEYPEFEGFSSWVAKVRAIESSAKL